MVNKISSRLENILKALPSKRGICILEIGCGPGVAARKIINLVPDCKVFAIDVQLFIDGGNPLMEVRLDNYRKT